MALILKHFLIEAYKIPTGSMQPTILGNDDVGIFDRVLVNKFAYLIDDPERYEVVVFKYPLDRSKNYIKRLIGLPGERVSIYNGNIYVAEREGDGYGSDRIARKPASVRDAVMKTIFPRGTDDETLETRFEVFAGDGQIDGEQIRMKAGGRFRYGHGESIRDAYLDGYDPDWGIPIAFRTPANGTETVGDLAISFDVTPADGCRQVEVVIFAFGLEHRAVLAVSDDAGSYLESGHRNGSDALVLPPFYDGDSTVRAESDRRIPAGSTSRVTFHHVDQELLLAVDGDEWMVDRYEISNPLYPSDNAIEISTTGGDASYSDLEVERDIHYTATGPSRKQVFDVHDDAIFVMGDNTQNSSDGRVWRAQTVRFPDGREITTERGQMANGGGYTDIYGETWPVSVRNQPRVESLGEHDFSFVPTNLLLGKAIAVFWPIYPHFRWKLIR